jgi:hypothetical protein
VRALGTIAIAGLALGAFVAFSVAVGAIDGGDPADTGAAPPAAPAVPGAPATDAGVAPGPAAGGGPDAGGRNRQQRRAWRRHAADARPAGDASRDGGVMAPMLARPAMLRPPVPAPAPPPPPPPPPPPSPGASKEAMSALSEFNTCHKIPSGKRVVKMNLRPDAELPDLIAWISSITCKPFVLPGHLSAQGKKLTIVAPNLMTREEAYAAFLNTLDSIGLTIERGSGYLRIIETAKAKSSAVPVYGFDGQPVKNASE